MSALVTNKVQLGQSGTANNNIVLQSDGAGGLEVRKGNQSAPGALIALISKRAWVKFPTGRAQSVDYTNNTGGEIVVNVSGTMGASGYINYYIDGILMGSSAQSYASGANVTLSFPVPSGSTYTVVQQVTTLTLTNWSEFRGT